MNKKLSLAGKNEILKLKYIFKRKLRSKKRKTSPAQSFITDIEANMLRFRNKNILIYKYRVNNISLNYLL